MASIWHGMFAVLLVSATYAEASPLVTVTVRNNGTRPIANECVTSNHRHTFLNASPAPKATLMPKEEDTFTVDNQVGDGANYAELQYRTGVERCDFKSLFVNKQVGYKLHTPQWFKFATAQSGAQCTAEIIAANATDHSWHVIFIMK